MSTMKVSIGLPFPQEQNISACLRRCFYNLNIEQVSAVGQAKTLTILISGKVPHSRVIFCCTLQPGIYTRVSFELGRARSRNNKYDWVFIGKNHTDDSRWCNGIYDLPACYRKPWPTSSVSLSFGCPSRHYQLFRNDYRNPLSQRFEISSVRVGAKRNDL